MQNASNNYKFNHAYEGQPVSVVTPWMVENAFEEGSVACFYNLTSKQLICVPTMLSYSA